MQVFCFVKESSNRHVDVVDLLVGGDSATVFDSEYFIALVPDGWRSIRRASRGYAGKNFHCNILHVWRFVANSVRVVEGNGLTATLFGAHASNVNARIP